jgi:hypothetical protein
MKFLCHCGSVIHTSGLIPNPSEYIFFADHEFTPFFDTEPLDASQVYSTARSIFRCATCGRLWVYWGGFDSPPICYRPEQPDGVADNQ